MLGLRTLVLQPDYTPESFFPLDSSTIPVEEGIVRVLKENATCLLTYNRQVLTPSRTDLFWPSIIVNKAFYKRYDDVRLKHETLFYRDHGICQYCEGELRLTGKRNITCDHVIPDSKGGAFSWENIVAACNRCNQEKDNQMPKGKWMPKRKPYKPTLGELIAKRRKFPITVDDPAWVDYIGGQTGWQGEVRIRHAARSALEQYGLV